MNTTPFIDEFVSPTTLEFYEQCCTFSTAIEDVVFDDSVISYNDDDVVYLWVTTQQSSTIIIILFIKQHVVEYVMFSVVYKENIVLGYYIWRRENHGYTAANSTD